MFELAVLASAIVILNARPRPNDGLGDRFERIAGMVLSLALLWAMVLEAADRSSVGDQWRRWIKEQATAVESAVAERVFSSSSPHPGVVKQTVGSSGALETKQ